MEISFKKLCSFLLKFWWLLVASAVVGGMIGFVAASSKEDTYRVSCQIKVTFENVDYSNPNFIEIRNSEIINFIEAVKGTDYLTKQFEAAGASSLLDTVKKKTVLDFVSVTRQTSSDFLTISCTTTNRTFSSKILSNILGTLDTVISDTLGKDRIGFAIVSTPKEVEEVVNPRITSALIGAVICFIVAAVVLIVIRIFDTRIYDGEEISERYQAVFLGSMKGGKRI